MSGAPRDFIVQMLRQTALYALQVGKIDDLCLFVSACSCLRRQMFACASDLASIGIIARAEVLTLDLFACTQIHIYIYIYIYTHVHQVHTTTTTRLGQKARLSAAPARAERTRTTLFPPPAPCVTRESRIKIKRGGPRASNARLTLRAEWASMLSSAPAKLTSTARYVLSAENCMQMCIVCMLRGLHRFSAHK